ncbi:DUF4235 domain-containing protein [Neoactinobaculum massilliense]|uniref:DUF4235 domain-containing protein n=1 Tax=Neoactinobaculum massilliense TaxID=2364794 RepID=UPI001F155D49|nr:DUF4235 domain-containing protein [Neoactinobaculum massilliense]
MAMDMGWKLVSAGAGIVSGIVANKLVDVAWGKLSGRDKPDLEDPDAPIVDVLVFTLVSGIVTSVLSSMVERKAARWYGKGGSAAVKAA